MDTSKHARIETEAADWLARRAGSHWHAADAAALAAWLQRDTAHRVAWLRLEAAWHESGRLHALGAGSEAGQCPPRASSPATLQPRNAASARPLHHRSGGRRLAIAASVVLAAVLGAGVVWTWQQRPTPLVRHFATAVGQLDSAHLDDGSHATLSSNSAIEVAMSPHERQIRLLGGEAFFEVAKDRTRPFVVAAGARRVVAVGTRFAVRRGDGTLHVVVTEGVVRLESPTPDGTQGEDSLLLPAGSIADAGPGGVTVRRATLAEAERSVEWRSGRLAFDDTPLAEAAADFNRYNTRQLVLGDAEVAKLRIGGNFLWSNPDGFVRLLESGFGVRAEVRGEQTVLYNR